MANWAELARKVSSQLVQAARVPCIIFMAEAISADIAVMFLGTINVVVASAATWL